jgi:hypothetical protein
MNSNAQRIVCLLAVYFGLTYSQNMEKLRHNLQLLFALVASQVFCNFRLERLDLKTFDESRSRCR